jgi:ABC-type transport system involved in cytochrome c biogenesis permease subunit
MQTLLIPFQLLTYVSMLFALYTIFIYAPVEKTMGLVQKIFYIHVPSAFLAYLAFFITFIASIFYLYRKDPNGIPLLIVRLKPGSYFVPSY